MILKKKYQPLSVLTDEYTNKLVLLNRRETMMTDNQLLLQLFVLAKAEIHKLREEFCEECVIHNGLSLELDDANLFEGVPYAYWSDRMVSIHAIIITHNRYMDLIETQLERTKPK